MSDKKKPKKPSKPKKAAKRPLTINDLARKSAKEPAASRRTARAQAVVDNPELGTEGFSQKDLRAVLLGLAERVVKGDEGHLVEHYNRHFANWREAASDKEVAEVHDAIGDWVDEGYLDNLHRHLAIFPFFYLDLPHVVHENAWLYVIHHPVVDDDRLYGLRIVLDTSVGRAAGLAGLTEADADARAEAIAHGISALFLCGDKRILPLMEDAWHKLPWVVRIHLSQCQEEVPTEVEAQFWLNRAAEETPGSPDFKLAIEHLMLMTDPKLRRFPISACYLVRNVFNFGLERGNDETRKTTQVQHDEFLNANAKVLARIESHPANKIFVQRLLKAWNCTEA